MVSTTTPGEGRQHDVHRVDPFRGYKRAINRGYARDHYYAACLGGPYLFAGSR
jgi:hypothetical protein